MAAHSVSEDDRAFRAAFEACAVEPAAFNHLAHLRLAYVYLVEHGPVDAHRVLAVGHFMSKSASSSFSEFAGKSQPLLDSKVMLTHYSAETLFSPEARASYVEPDLEAIPQDREPPKGVA